MTGAARLALAMRLRWLFIVAGLIVLPWFLQNAFLQHVLVITLIYLVLILGLNIVIGFTGQIALCQAALYGVGAYASAILVKQTSLPFWLSLPFAVFVCAGLGFLLSSCVVKMRSHYLALATIGFGEILINVFRSAGSLTGGANGLAGIPAPRIGGWVIDSPLSYYYLALSVAVLGYVGMISIRRSQLGVALRAVRDNEIAASSLGVNSVRLKVLAFTLCAAYAGAAGALYAHFDGFIGPESFSTSQSILLFCVLVVGGLGRPLGSLIGAVLFVVGQEFFRAFSQYQLVLFGSTVIIVMAFAPQGLAGLFRSLVLRTTGGNIDEALVEGVTTWNPNGAKAPYSFTKSATPFSLELPPISDGPISAKDAVVIDDLVVRYGGVTALDHVSFSVKSGEIFCLIGPNGAGKTTLLNTIGGQQKPAKGRLMLSPKFETGVRSSKSVRLVGRRSYEVARLGLSRTFQTSQLFPELSSVDNVMVGQYLHREMRTSLLGIFFLPWLAKRQDTVAREEAQNWLRFTGLYKYRHNLAKHLPYGLRRVLEIARCMATKPAVLLLDEPSAGMSASERTALVDLLRAISNLGVTLIIVAHDLELVRTLAQHVVVLDYGKVIFDGHPKDLRENAKVVDAYLGRKRIELEPVF
jgi:branched-chain amino acid transport system permease protein